MLRETCCFSFTERNNLFISLGFCSRDKGGPDLKPFLFADPRTSFAVFFPPSRQTHQCTGSITCHNLDQSSACKKTQQKQKQSRTAPSSIFGGLSNSLFYLPSLQPFQLGFARTERKSPDIPAGVSVCKLHDMNSAFTEVLELWSSS